MVSSGDMSEKGLAYCIEGISLEVASECDFTTNLIWEGRFQDERLQRQAAGATKRLSFRWLNLSSEVV